MDSTINGAGKSSDTTSQGGGSSEKNSDPTASQEPVNGKCSAGGTEQPFAHVTSVQQAAAIYSQHGLQPIPNKPSGKSPLVAGWQTFECAQEEIPKHFPSGCNIGLLLNPESGSLVDIDLDVVEACRLADEFLPQTEFVFGRISRPASHRFYICKPQPKKTAFKIQLAGEAINLLELRTGAHQTMVPPSTHPSGEVVRFEEGLAGLPTQVDGPLLVRAVAYLAVATVMTKMWPKKKGARHDMALAFSGGLCNAGIPEHEAERIVGVVAKAAGDDEVEDRVKAVETTYVQHHAGENHTGWPMLAGLLGDDGSEVVKKCREWLGDTESPDLGNVERRAPKNFLLSVSQLKALDIPKREDIVAPWVKTGSLVLAYSAPKVGKTWFFMGLAHAVGSGEKFLSWAVPKPRRVLYVDGEMPFDEFKERIEQVVRTADNNVTVIASQHLYKAGEKPLNLVDEVDQKWLDEAIEACGAEVIILDTLSSLTAGRDENNNSDPALERFLAWLISLRHRGKAVIIVHHSGHDGRHPRGASRIEGVVDTVVKLTKEDGEGVFCITFPRLRGEVPKPAALTVRLASYDLIGGVKIKVLEPTGKPDKTPTILLTIASGKAKTQQQLATKLEISTGQTSKLLKELRAEGLVADGKVSLTAKGQKLADEAAQGGEFQPAA